MGVEVDWAFFREQLPDGWRELAVERRLIRPHPPHLGAKVTDIEPVLRLILHRAGLQTSLRTAAGEAAAAQMIDLSAVALHKWERKLGPYLAELTAQLCRAPTHFAPQRWSGYDVFAVDASTMTRPHAVGTLARVHYVLRLATLDFVQSTATDEHGGETLRLHEGIAAPGQLWIADRAYSNPPGIAALVGKGATVIVRCNRGVLRLYDEQDEPLDMLALVRTLQQPGKAKDWRVWIHTDHGGRIRGRLCAVRLPEDKVEQARQRLRREHGPHVPTETLEAAAWVMVFTTVPRCRMKAARVLELYRMRWQIELEIKRDKSIGGLDRLPNFRSDTIVTWLQAKLLIQIVAKKIASLAETFSPSLADWQLRAVDPLLRSLARSAHRPRSMARDGVARCSRPRGAPFRRAA